MKNHPLAHFNERPNNTIIDTLVIHSIYAPLCPNPFSTEEIIASLDTHKVAAHYLISREGEIWNLVEESKRAWHAGTSQMPYPDDMRNVVNDFSIGIELIASEDSGFTEAQYQALQSLIIDITTRYPIRNVVGHDMIAPDRKKDPGDFFDWEKLNTLLSTLKLRVGLQS